jgi:hypothetical protein
MKVVNEVATNHGIIINRNADDNQPPYGCLSDSYAPSNAYGLLLGTLFGVKLIALFDVATRRA